MSGIEVANVVLWMHGDSGVGRGSGDVEGKDVGLSSRSGRGVGGLVVSQVSNLRPETLAVSSRHQGTVDEEEFKPKQYFGEGLVSFPGLLSLSDLFRSFRSKLNFHYRSVVSNSFLNVGWGPRNGLGSFRLG